MGLILAAYYNDDINCAHFTGETVEAEDPVPDGNLFTEATLEEMVDTAPKADPAPVTDKPKAPANPKKKGVWKEKIGSFVGGIFDSVMNEVESDR